MHTRGLSIGAHHSELADRQLGKRPGAPTLHRGELQPRSFTSMASGERGRVGRPLTCSDIVLTHPLQAFRATSITSLRLGELSSAPAANHLDQLVGVIYRSAQAREGFTINSQTLRTPRYGPDDYVVSLLGHELRWMGAPALFKVRRWIEERVGRLMGDGKYVGGWLNPQDESYSVDLSVVITGRRCAENCGRANGQDAIYHPATDQTMWLRPAAGTGKECVHAEAREVLL